MQGMTVNEFVSKVIKDRDFLVEVCKNIPDELLQEEQPTEPGAGLGALMSKYFFAATQAMELSFDEDEFAAECDRQMNSMSTFAKIKYTGRFIRTLAKLGKGNKNKK